jgi:hypothetical protein
LWPAVSDAIPKGHAPTLQIYAEAIAKFFGRQSKHTVSKCLTPMAAGSNAQPPGTAPLYLRDRKRLRNTQMNNQQKK